MADSSYIKEKIPLNIQGINYYTNHRCIIEIATFSTKDLCTNDFYSPCSNNINILKSTYSLIFYMLINAFINQCSENNFFKDF